jgi:hypothetical protein
MATSVRGSGGGFAFRMYRGDGAALLAFDVSDETMLDRLAGFAVRYTSPSGVERPVKNRLRFDASTSAATALRWTDTAKAPLQRFHWAHFPSVVETGNYVYEATAKLFVKPDGSELEDGPTVTLSLDLGLREQERFQIGFTRGYVSSQAYIERFDHRGLAPDPQTIDYGTAEYEDQYAWLGHRGRKLLFDFLTACAADPATSVDCFAFDLDEPDVIRALSALAGRVRVILDDSARSTGMGQRQAAATQRLIDTLGQDSVKTGHFARFSHDKVLIQLRGGQPARVLTGSANFTLRGLYVQANNVLVIDDAKTAGLYETAFEQAWTDMAGFESTDIASRWFAVRGTELPRFSVSFAPHATAEVSLDRVADAIAGAKSSVLFSIMGLGGQGRVLEQLRTLAQAGEVFSLGMVQSTDGSISVKTPGRVRGELVPFAFLHDHVPPPFQKEVSGGNGQVIHHKFVVVDFNGPSPLVFTGSSNLAAGGETSNGDNLLAIASREAATLYAVEAIRLVDHYRFRAAQRSATDSQPLRLRTQDEQWWKQSYEVGSIRETERTLFARGPGQA